MKYKWIIRFMEYDFVKNEIRIKECKKTWDVLLDKYKINDDTAILVLADEDKSLDCMSLEYLPNFVSRKKATQALVLTSSIETESYAKDISYAFPVRIACVENKALRDIFDYYCFAFNLDNIAFTFLEQCPYNLLGRIVRETEVTEEEAVCLGVYWLREIQEKMLNV